MDADLRRHDDVGAVRVSIVGTPGRTGRTVLVAAIALLCTLLLPAGAALAQEARAPHETPARIGNIWDGFDHQPTESQVQGAERASGIALSAREQRREAQVVQQLDRELLKSAGAGRTGAAVG